MPTRSAPLWVIWGHEWKAAMRGRMIPAFALLFAVLCLGIALAGLAASGEVLVQGFPRTSVSMLGIAVYLFPLLGALVGASVFGGEDGGTELLLAQPVGRGEALMGRSLGLAAAFTVVPLAGFGIAAPVIGAKTGPEGAGGYLLVALGTTGVGLAWLAVGILLGVLARRRSTAVGWALGAWLAAAVLYDLACIAALQVAGDGQPGPLLVWLLGLNPIDGVRSAAMLQLGADVLLGPTGVALESLLGRGGGVPLVLASLALWLAAPLGIAGVVYRRRDF